MMVHLANLELTNFGYVKAIANIHDKHDRSTPSHFHWKILKCRMLIFSNSSILASPDRKDLQQVHIVFNKCGDNYDKLNSLFMKFSLVQHGEIRPTTPDIFQMCFHYTMTARIAPAWNTLGENHLINNRDFLITKGTQDGITYNVVVNNEHVLSLELKSVKINLLINDDVFAPAEWIRVLPSLNKAIVHEYHEKIPRASKFRCYKDLRRHWKNIVSSITSDIKKKIKEGIKGRDKFDSQQKIIEKFLTCLETKMLKGLGSEFNIEHFESEKHSLMVPKLNLQDTQAVSLCTPTQFGNGYSHSGNYK